jgi:signal peptide peptidase SppA
MTTQTKATNNAMPDQRDNLTQLLMAGGSWELLAMSEQTGRFINPEAKVPASEMSLRMFDGMSGVSASQSVGKIAVLPVIGVLSKYGSWSGTSTQWIAEQARKLAADESVSGCLLLVDSPGGQVAGTYDAVAAIRELDQKKPVHSYVTDGAYSAGYALASAARKINANPASALGSIGTYMVIRDFSRMFANDGVETIVINAGEFKGLGTQGTPITDAHKAELLRFVNAQNEMFLASVAQGRKLKPEQVQQLADGRWHMAQLAVEMGLADGICSMDAAIEQLTQAALMTTATGKSSRPKKGRTKMEAATFAELKAALPDATAEFIVKQLEAGATTSQAQSAWMSHLKAEMDAAKADAAASKKLVEEADAKAKQMANGGNAHLGAPDLSGGKAGDIKAGGNSDPVMAYNAKVAEVMGLMSCDRFAAIQYVNRHFAEMNQAFLVATNNTSGQQGLTIRNEFAAKFTEKQAAAKATAQQ